MERDHEIAQMGSAENVFEFPQENEKVSELLEAETRYWKLRFSFMNVACLECAIQLGIPDAIYNHENHIISLSQLITTQPIHPSKASHIHRLMRILVNASFFAEKQRIDLSGCEEKCFFLTPLGRLLTEEGARMASRMLPLAFCPPMQKPWMHLSEWFKNDDDCPFETAHGKKFWNYFADDPTFQHVFNEAMAGDSEFTAMVLMKQCRFSFEGLKSLVDVGGGTGTTAKAIAEKFPGLKCSVLDLPHVVYNQKGTENLDFIGGSMFDEIPKANAVLLKFILHNWTDEDCIKILKKCKKSIPSKDLGGKLIVVDVVMVEPESSDGHEVMEAQSCFDMQMLVQFGGRERTEKNFATLFEKSGFTGYKVFPVLGYRSLIEAYP